MTTPDYWKLAVALVVSQLAGIIGSFFTAPAIPGWYSSLIRPEFAPPNWVFAPAWTTLFILMGVAAFLVWRKGLAHKGVLLALVFFVLQLVLNTCWSIIFFGLQSPGWALIEIGFLWTAVVITMLSFASVSRTAALLLTPYILWVTYAAYLNYSFFQLNP